MKNTENNTISRYNAYHETKKHSDTMFAYNVYPCTIPQDFSFVSMHWQDSVEMIYIKRGTGLVQIDAATYTAQPGDVFLIMPGHIHGLRHMEEQRMEYENIIFDPEFLGAANMDLCSQQYWQPLFDGRLSLPVHIGNDHPLHPSVCACLDSSDALCDRRPTGYELAVKGNLLLIFSQLFQMASQTDAMDSKHIQKIKSALQYVEEHFDQDLTIEKMAGHCGYSASHFMRWFKEMTGCGFHNYLIEFRLGKAAFELRATGDTVLAIASRTGFNNLSNFNRLFKKKFGMTPNQFRLSDPSCSSLGRNPSNINKS